MERRSSLFAKGMLVNFILMAGVLGYSVYQKGKEITSLRKDLDRERQKTARVQALLDDFTDELVPYALGVDTQPAEGGFLETLLLMRDNATITLGGERTIHVDINGKNILLPRKGMNIPPYANSFDVVVRDSQFDTRNVEYDSPIVRSGASARTEGFKESRNAKYGTITGFKGNADFFNMNNYGQGFSFSGEPSVTIERTFFEDVPRVIVLPNQGSSRGINGNTCQDIGGVNSLFYPPTRFTSESNPSVRIDGNSLNDLMIDPPVIYPDGTDSFPCYGIKPFDGNIFIDPTWEFKQIDEK